MKKMILVLMTSLFFGGCGGGGSSSGTTAVANGGFTGNVNQAVLTTGNARGMSVNAVQGIQETAMLGVLKAAGSGVAISPRVQQIGNIVDGIAANAVAKTAGKTVAASSQGTVPGVSGSYTFSVTADQNTGAGSGSIAFTQYQADSTSPKITGVVTFVAVVNGGIISDVSISIANVVFSSGSQAFSLYGAVSTSVNVISTTMSLSVVETDLSNNATYWQRDFALALTGNSMTITGRYYDPTYGYVDITTAAPLIASTFSSQPNSGQLLFSGSNGTKARITFNTSGNVLEVDTAGLGTYVVVP